MNSNSHRDRAGGLVRAAGAFAFTLVLAGLFPLGRLVLFPYGLLAVRDGSQWHHILTHAQAIRLSLLQWGGATFAFGALASKERPVVLIPLALATLTIVIIAVLAIVNWSGLTFYWDLWH